MPSSFASVQHIVVVMLENHSFDHLLGFLYAEKNSQPPLNLPAHTQPTYDGLLPPDVTDLFWCPSNADYFSGSDPQKVFATRGTDTFTLPDPDPNELFPNFTYQLFGPATDIAPGKIPEMKGFLVDYQTAKGSSPDLAKRIMQMYSPEKLPVLSQLARNYAVSDAWFASVPAQTWPNRAFLHTGTSRGMVTNGNIFAYRTQTIFDVLKKVGKSWNVYTDSQLLSLTKAMYPLLEWALGHFRTFAQFQSDAQAGTLPQYTFLEPAFVYQPEDEAPTHDVRLGEQFLWKIWKAVSTGPHWSGTLLVILFDEHGGCYDHVPPPWGAAIPDAESETKQPGFRFDRFGVRVPAVVVSPLIEAGTVFRSPTDVPLDHTTILATLRDWLQITGESMLASKRVAMAPTLEFLLTRDEARTDLPDITPHAVAVKAAPGVPTVAEDDMPLSDLQFSMAVATEEDSQQRDLTGAEIQQLRQRVWTKKHLRQHVHDAASRKRAAGREPNTR